jgi:flagellar biosynthesis chaperone FliJ
MVMRTQRKVETPEEREARMIREAQTRRERIAADDAAVERMIRLNIQQFGP